jgi:hypothetical protein
MIGLNAGLRRGLLLLPFLFAASLLAGEVRVHDGYPPVPQPVRGKTELGVYIFPGWYRDKGRGDYPYRTHDEDSEWRAIAKKPNPRALLGFYDDSLPEVNDWHILWALEHGISWFAFDWYWNAGEHRLLRTLERGFLKAKYAPMMKFCIHWCNHSLDWHTTNQGWRTMMGLRKVRVQDGALAAEATGIDPAFRCAVDFDASQYTHLAVRMKASAGHKAQMFWSTPTEKAGEANSAAFTLIPDGQFHEYLVDLRTIKGWQGQIQGLRFDPNAGSPASSFAIDWIRLLRGADTRTGELGWEFEDGDGSASLGGLAFHPKALVGMTEYMADHYFGLPNYLTVDGRPVLMVWDTNALFAANGGPDGFRKALAQMNAVLHQRGMKDLYLVSMGRTRNEQAAGFSAMTGYGYYSVPFDSPFEWRGGHSVPYSEVLRQYENRWGAYVEKAYLPYIPPIGSNWDSRPRHGDRAAVVSDYTPENFRRMCTLSRTYIGTGKAMDMAIIEAWNEWGEGSFIEPDQEYRFGFLDALRDTFTDAPKNHVDYMPTPEKIASFSVLSPEDVAKAKENESLPYPDPPRLRRAVRWLVDQPLPKTPLLGQWEFTGKDADGWELLRLKDVTVADSILAATVSAEDPQFIMSNLDVPIDRIQCVALRLRVPENIGSCEVFWATDREPELSADKAFRFPLQRDGEWHTYQVSRQIGNKWEGRLQILRFDMGSTGDRLQVDWVRLIGKE